VDKVNWSAAQSMSFLFGHLYDSPCKFTHDQAMFRKKGGDAGIVPESRPRTLDNNIAEPSVGRDVDREQEPRSFPADVSLQHLPNTKASYRRSHDLPALAQEHDKAPVVSDTGDTTRKRRRPDTPSENRQAVPSVQAERNTANISDSSSTSLQIPSAAPLSSYEYSEAWKQQAFEAAQGTGSSNWNDITLVSVSGHQEREKEL
jgi:hypothetical protein